MKSQRISSSRSGLTLIEMVMSSGIAALVVAGIASSISVSLKGIPDLRASAAPATVRAGRIVDQLATELETAIYITERSATAIGFTVADRDGDGIPERVRYAWTGTPGGPLTRQYNGMGTVILASSVNLFSLTPAIKSVAETYPALATEDISESLLIDYNGTTGLGNNDVTATNWVGQYFTMTLPAEAYAWRPTRVKFMAKSSSLPAITRVQMRPADSTLKPTTTILEEYLLLDTSLTTSYAWKDIAFSSLDPISPVGSICRVLQQQLGTKSLTAQNTGDFAGLLKTTNSGSSWSYDNGHSLVSQLYGKLTTSNGTQSINSNYLTSMGIVLRSSSTSPTLRTTASALNHPELLSGKWELDFQQNPTTKDGNGDGIGDWVVNGGGSFNAASIVNGVWQTTGTQLNTNPGNDFSKTTVIDVRFRNTSVGGNGATLSINALRNGSTCAPIQASLKLQADGTQTLTLSKKTLDVLWQTLVSIPGLPSQPVDLHLIIDPTTSAVSITVNAVQRGTFGVTQFLSTDNSRFAAIGASGSTAEFSYVRVRVLE